MVAGLGVPIFRVFTVTRNEKVCSWGSLRVSTLRKHRTMKLVKFLPEYIPFTIMGSVL